MLADVENFSCVRLRRIASIAIPEIASREVVENIHRLRAGETLLNVIEAARDIERLLTH